MCKYCLPLCQFSYAVSRFKFLSMCNVTVLVFVMLFVRNFVMCNELVLLRGPCALEIKFIIIIIIIIGNSDWPEEIFRPITFHFTEMVSLLPLLTTQRRPNLYAA